jgi:hypothetical protein
MSDQGLVRRPRIGIAFGSRCVNEDKRDGYGKEQPWTESNVVRA